MGTPWQKDLARAGLRYIFASQAIVGWGLGEFIYFTVDFMELPFVSVLSLALFVIYHLSLQLFLPDLIDVVVTRKLLHSMTGICTIIHIIYLGNSQKKVSDWYWLSLCKPLITPLIWVEFVWIYIGMSKIKFWPRPSISSLLTSPIMQSWMLIVWLKPEIGFFTEAGTPWSFPATEHQLSIPGNFCWLKQFKLPV